MGWSTYKNVLFYQGFIKISYYNQHSESEYYIFNAES